MVTFQPLTCPLFVPATRPDRFHKAAESGADAIIIDLEDAVAPHAKDGARDALAGHVDGFSVPVFLRVNGRATPWHEADLAVASKLPISGVMLPKTETANDLCQVANTIGCSNVPIIALVETAHGIAHLSQLGVSPNLVQLAFGSVDYALDIGAAHQREALLLARGNMVLYSRAYGLPAPLDGVTVAINDVSLLASDSNHAAAMGFGGKLAIHPAQIETIRAAFRPKQQEIDWATRVLAVEREAAGAAALINGTMIDAPLCERARRILAKAK
ncbi:HpcH/HpaI aldolase/citrate lyase family protein [Brucella lupini]|uniref:CoA ester lyase n=1 Tax=Brucella lupini TaxID=255457 RepID=A0A256GZT7_9HYPH|nr:CoA ester lyase [Brucella lupini]KAB2703222.1 CoA ester lyase [Brucella lupini]OYR32508.1 hpcH/HpaI aldolase/citrate lyase family protein [Brucella lupini]